MIIWTLLLLLTAALVESTRGIYGDYRYKALKTSQAKVSSRFMNVLFKEVFYYDRKRYPAIPSAR